MNKVFNMTLCMEEHIRIFKLCTKSWRRDVRMALGLYRETESYVSHHQTSKHQCTRLGSVPILNSQSKQSLARDESLHIKF